MTLAAGRRGAGVCRALRDGILALLPVLAGVRAGVRAGVLAGVLAAASAAPARAEPPRLDLPLDCDPGRSCWITKHVDVDPGPGDRDYACGRLTQDGHKGTDIGVTDMTVARRGVAVRAAAAGVVAATRDGMRDANVARLSDAAREALQTSACGNAVIVDHGDGWRTWYCHLRQGSVAVAQGQRVAAGTPLGQVGMSGMAEHPHLHFGVHKDGDPVDPFRGPGAGADAPDCGVGPAPLWSPSVLEALPYRPAVINAMGVAGRQPDRLDARDGRYADATVAADAPVLVGWVDAFGLGAGDRILMHMTTPDGTVFVDTGRRLAREQLQTFTFFGRRLTPERGRWPVGTWSLTVTLVRAGASGPGAEVRRSQRFTVVADE